MIVPSIAILGVHVTPQLDEKTYNFQMSGTNGIVQRRNTLVVGSTRIGNLMIAKKFKKKTINL